MTLTVEVQTRPFIKVITVPTSKSYCNRLLIMASISPHPIEIRRYPHSTDVLNLIACLRRVGLIIEEEGEENLVVKGPFPACESATAEGEVLLSTGDGGTTNRFLMALLARGSKKYLLRAEGSMAERPMEEFYSLLRKLGVSVRPVDPERGNFPVLIKGPIDLGKEGRQRIEVDCQRSSQFISALKLAFYNNDALEFSPQKLTSSRSYYELTCELVEEFRAREKEGIFSFTVPVDFSSVTYPLALALLTGRTQVKNLERIDWSQADAAFFPIVRKMGGDYSINQDQGLVMEKCPSLRGIDVDCAGHPDLVPTLAFLCSYAEGPSHLSNLGGLEFKESSRIQEIISILDQFGVIHHFDSQAKSLTIQGGSARVGRRDIHAVSDHRIIMMTYLFMRYNGGGALSNAHHVSKSFPDFFQIMG